MFLSWMYYGFSTVILVSRLFISWISDATRSFSGSLFFGWSSSVVFVLPGGMPSRFTAVSDGCEFLFLVCFAYYCFVWAGSFLMPSVGLFWRDSHVIYRVSCLRVRFLMQHVVPFSGLAPFGCL